MKNLFNKIFKKNNHKNATTKNATTIRKFAGSASNGDELLDLKYRGLKQGYTVSVETFTSSFGTVHNVYYR